MRPDSTMRISPVNAATNPVRPAHGLPRAAAMHGKPGWRPANVRRPATARLVSGPRCTEYLGMENRPRPLDSLKKPVNSASVPASGHKWPGTMRNSALAPLRNWMAWFVRPAWGGRPAQLFAFGDIRVAHSLMEQGAAHGKLVVQLPQSSPRRSTIT